MSTRHPGGIGGEGLGEGPGRWRARSGGRPRGSGVGMVIAGK